MRDHWLGDLLILTLLVGLFFGFGLGGRALWAPDEGRYSEVAREMIVSGDYIAPRLDGVKFFEKPQLFYWSQIGAIKLFGLNEWALRFGPALAALLSCLTVYGCGRKLFGRKSGWCAAIVLATCGLHYALSRTANLDMGLSALITFALISFLLGTREPLGRRRRFAMWCFFVFAALAVLQKGLVGIVLPGLIIGSWIALTGEWKMLKTFYLRSGVVLFAAITLPWHVAVSTTNPEFVDFYFVREHFQRFLFKNGPLDHPWTYVPVLLIGLFPWTAFLYQAIRYNLFRLWRPRHGYREAMFLALWAGWVLLFFSISSSKVIPYILPMFPPLAILLGRYFSTAVTRPGVDGLRTGYAVLLVAIMILWPFTAKGPQHYFERYSNWPNLDVPVEETTLPSTTVSDYSDLQKMRPYVAAQIGILLVGVVVALLLVRRQKQAASFASLAIASTLSLIILNQSLPLFDQRRSVKDLALSLKPALRADDEVSTYHAYYQDLPFYLQRHVTQVGWVEPFEVWEEESNKQASDDRSLWQKWNGPRRLFVVTDKANYDLLRRDPQRPLHLVVENAYSVVFSNRTVGQQAVN